MDKFDMVVALVMEQLQMGREAICSSRNEHLTITVTFQENRKSGQTDGRWEHRKEFGMPKRAQLACSHVYDGPANSAPESMKRIGRA